MTVSINTDKQRQEIREEINFLRSQIVYLINSGSEKMQGLKFAKKLGQLSEALEMHEEKVPRLYELAFASWREAVNKFSN